MEVRVWVRAWVRVRVGLRVGVGVIARVGVRGMLLDLLSDEGEVRHRAQRHLGVQGRG